MPRVALTKEQKLNQRIEKITKETKLALYDAGIQKKAVAEVAGVTPAAVTMQFKSGRLTLPVLMAAQLLLEEQ